QCVTHPCKIVPERLVRASPLRQVQCVEANLRALAVRKTIPEETWPDHCVHGQRLLDTAPQEVGVSPSSIPSGNRGYKHLPSVEPQQGFLNFMSLWLITCTQRHANRSFVKHWHVLGFCSQTQ